MTNKEFYFDKLLAIALSFGCQKLIRLIYGEECNGKGCDDCEFNRLEDIESWLNAEYVEPDPSLLENGDGLKPGDWIMGRYDDDAPWTKTQFLAYIDGVFYTREPLNGGAFKFAVYYQARLPMEGE